MPFFLCPGASLSSGTHAAVYFVCGDDKSTFGIEVHHMSYVYVFVCGISSSI